MPRNINEAILTALYENDEKLCDLIADHLGIDGQDHSWLVSSVADVLSGRISENLASFELVRQLKRHLKPVVEQAAADEMERLEDCA